MLLSRHMRNVSKIFIMWNDMRSTQLHMQFRRHTRKQRYSTISNVLLSASKVPSTSNHGLRGPAPSSIWKTPEEKIYLWPASTTTGMKAGKTVQTVLNLAGFKNVKSKVIGSRNPLNTMRALFKALNAIETPKDIQEKFGRTVVEKYLL
uniref:Small ribosomal subunit protein uS5 C-terminal domain-containing protein n=1 Tax=Cucumis sativus TaxID=3659 RepID=A0A0A0LRA1_CUCSA